MTCLCVGLIRKSEAIDEAKIKPWKAITMINTKKPNYGSLAEGLDFKLEFWYFERESLRACKWRKIIMELLVTGYSWEQKNVTLIHFYFWG